MRFAKLCAKAEANGCSNGIIVQMQTASRQGQGMQPVTAVRGRNSQQTGTINRVCMPANKSTKLKFANFEVLVALFVSRRTKWKFRASD